MVYQQEGGCYCVIMAGQPMKDSVAHRLLFEDLVETPPSALELIAKNAEQKIPTHFDERFIRKFDEKNPHEKLTKEEREEIEREIAENGWGNICRCDQADFKDQDFSMRQMKAVMVNLYFEYGGDWGKVFRDSRSCSRRAMTVYWRCELFRSYIQALEPILMLEARGVVVEVWKDGLDEKARLAAALRFLEAHDARTWDRGVRKQIIANKGTLQSALFNRAISDDEFLNNFIKDRLNKLPDNVRAVLADSLSKPAEQTEAAPPNEHIHTVDINKLTDPF